MEILERIKGSKATSHLIELTDINGRLPLHYALEKANEHSIRVLLDYNVEHLLTRDIFGETPLHSFIRYGSHGVGNNVPLFADLIDECRGKRKFDVERRSRVKSLNIIGAKEDSIDDDDTKSDTSSIVAKVKKAFKKPSLPKYDIPWGELILVASVMDLLYYMDICSLNYKQTIL